MTGVNGEISAQKEGKEANWKQTSNTNKTQWNPWLIIPDGSPERKKKRDSGRSNDLTHVNT